MIKNFKNFVLEGRGISDNIKAYSIFIYSLFKNIDSYEQMDLEYEPFKLMDLKIYFVMSDYYHGEYSFRDTYIKDDKLYEVAITLKIDRNDVIKSKIIGLIAHELTHLKEYLDIHRKIEKTKIDIEPNYIKIREVYRNMKIETKDPYHKFIYLLYLSLDTEMNARIAQVYDYLLEFNIKDENILFDKLKLHKNWEFLEMLNNFDSKKFVDDNVNNIEVSGLLKITKELIDKFKDKNLNTNSKMLFLNKNINDIDDLYRFYFDFRNYFKEKCKKHIKKYKNLIKEVIKDLNNEKSS